MLKDNLRGVPSLESPLPDVNFALFPRTPQEAFAVWFDDALAAGVREPHAMTLSTRDESGFPDARILILKNVDARGWHFAIKADSPKADQITSEPHVALTFYWSVLGRQVRLRGVATLLPPSECAQDYLERPHGSRVSALASRQSEVLADISELEKGLALAEALLSANPHYVVPDWRVYAVMPNVVEFWQGASDRNHKRLAYILRESDDGWEMVRLWP